MTHAAFCQTAITRMTRKGISSIWTPFAHLLYLLFPGLLAKGENAWQTQMEDVWDRDMLKILNVDKTSDPSISSQAQSLKWPYTAPNLRSDHLTPSTMQTVKHSQFLMHSKHE